MSEYFSLKVVANNVCQKRMQKCDFIGFHQNKTYAGHFIRLFVCAHLTI